MTRPAMPTTDRRARRLAIARRRPRPVRQGSDEWFRRLAKAFRRMEMYQIARRRERIAAQPRVGDRVIGRDGNEWRVAEVSSDLVWCDLTPDKFRTTQAMAVVLGLCIIRIRGSSTREQWRELVRRARTTQEGPV